MEGSGTSSGSRSTRARSVTSRSIAHAASPSSAANASSDNPSRSTRTTRRPLATAARAIPLPMPPAAPVSRTTSAIPLSYLLRLCSGSHIVRQLQIENRPVREGTIQDATNTTVSAALAAFVAGAEALPTSLLDQGKSALLNVFGTALGSARAPAVEGAARVTGILSGVGEATVIGRSERLRAAEAASSVNALAMNLLDFDDTHLPTVSSIWPRRSRRGARSGKSSGSTARRRWPRRPWGGGRLPRWRHGLARPLRARSWAYYLDARTFGAAARRSKRLAAKRAQTGHATRSSHPVSTCRKRPKPSDLGKNASVGNAPPICILAAASQPEEGYESAPAALEGRSAGRKPVEMLSGYRARSCATSGVAGISRSNAIKPTDSESCSTLSSMCPSPPRQARLTPELIEPGSCQRLFPFPCRGRTEKFAPWGDARAAAFSTPRRSPSFTDGLGALEFDHSRATAPEVANSGAKVRGELDASLAPGAATVEVRLSDGRSFHRDGAARPRQHRATYERE